MFDFMVYIGRFQFLHNGHIATFKKAKNETKHLIVLVGSANLARSPKNPLTYQERYDLIHDELMYVFVGDETKFTIKPIRDYPYNMFDWINHVSDTVTGIIDTNFDFNKNLTPKIGITGFSKDSSSFYLKAFPRWVDATVDSQYGTLNATDLRKDYIRRSPIIPDTHICPPHVNKFLKKFMLTPDFAALVKENEYYEQYKLDNNKNKYPAFICCVDNVFVRDYKILLIERGGSPGKGLLALPGGHVEINEPFIDAAVRELKEETHIAFEGNELTTDELKRLITSSHLFDDPSRSERGRVVTNAYYYKDEIFSDMYDVRGDDDAISAKWYDLDSLKHQMFFEDHASIIENVVNYDIQW